MSSLVDPEKAKSVSEGKAKVDLPKSVFYNPVQEFNRDLTIAVIRTAASELSELKQQPGKKPIDSKPLQQSGEISLNSSGELCVDECQANVRCDDDKSGEVTESSSSGTSDPIGKGIRILEALAASGLRSVRFALEIPGVREVLANDFDRTAVEFIKHNAEKNGVSHLVKASCSDASMVMYSLRHHSNRFDVVDLDPYGSPAPFLDAAIQCVTDGGLLCVTSTDMAVLCGNAAETCHSKYGAVSVRSPFCHEMALRILLQSIASHAGRYQRYIEPLLSLSVDFYVRVFVRVRTGQSRVKDVATQMSNVYHCRRCGAFTLQPLMIKSEHLYVIGSGPPVGPQCEICNGRHVVVGPIWTSPIHDQSFAKLVSETVTKDSSLFPSTRDRMMGVLSVVGEELSDCPLYYVIDDLCSVIHCTPPGLLSFRSALLHAGFRVSMSHAKKNSMKTNAPLSVIWDILRCWVQSNPVKANRLQEGSAAKIILSKQPELCADFSLHPDANPASRVAGLVRWQINPERDWGPKPRAPRSGKAETIEDRRHKGEEKADVLRQKRKKLKDLKKQPCKKYSRGACELGDQCKYSHNEFD